MGDGLGGRGHRTRHLHSGFRLELVSRPDRPLRVAQIRTSGPHRRRSACSTVFAAPPCHDRRPEGVQSILGPGGRYGGNTEALSAGEIVAAARRSFHLGASDCTIAEHFPAARRQWTRDVGVRDERGAERQAAALAAHPAIPGFERHGTNRRFHSPSDIQRHAIGEPEYRRARCRGVSDAR